MPIRQDIPALGVDNKPRRLATHGHIGVKRASLAVVDGHDAPDDLLDGGLPLRRVGLGGAQRQ